LKRTSPAGCARRWLIPRRRKHGCEIGTIGTLREVESEFGLCNLNMFRVNDARLSVICVRMPSSDTRGSVVILGGKTSSSSSATADLYGTPSSSEEVEPVTAGLPR